jgi:hypothetical protein
MAFNNVKALGIAASIALAVAGSSLRLTAQTAPTILVSPAETPGQFTYAFVDPAANDGHWVAIDFHRDPECAEVSGFNLLLFVDFPNALACPLTVSTKEWWNDIDLATAGGPWQSPPWVPTFRTPVQARWRGNGAVPIYFVDIEDLLDAIGDDVVTVAELKRLPSLKVGYASEYLFIQHSSSRSNSFTTSREGQTETTAQGVLEDGRSFQFHRTTHGPETVILVKIDFK